MTNNNETSSTSKRPANSEDCVDGGTLAKRKKMNNNTAVVQIATEPATDPFSVMLSQNFSTVVEHANFLREKINQSQGAILDGKLKLDGTVALIAVIMDNSALFDYDVQLDEASMYTFHFKLATGEGEGQAENGPNLVDKLATQVAEFEEKMVQQQEQHKSEKEALTMLVDEQINKLTNLEEKQTKDHDKMEELASKNGTLEKQVKEQAGKMKELEMKMRLGEEKEQAAEYARLIGMPNVSNLKGNYEKEKMLNLLKHGNDIGTKLYIQEDQQLGGGESLQSIVDLLASAKNPEKMIGEVTIEADKICFKWPQNEELKLKGKQTNVEMKRNETTANPSIFSDRYLAEYELTNKDSRFQINMYYWKEEYFNKWVEKFLYRRLA